MVNQGGTQEIVLAADSEERSLFEEYAKGMRGQEVWGSNLQRITFIFSLCGTLG